MLQYELPSYPASSRPTMMRSTAALVCATTRMRAPRSGASTGTCCSCAPQPDAASSHVNGLCRRVT